MITAAAAARKTTKKARAIVIQYQRSLNALSPWFNSTTNIPREAIQKQRLPPATLLGNAI